MRILHVIGSAHFSGGGVIEGILATSEVWGRNDIDCDILSLDFDDAHCVVASPVPMFGLGGNDKIHKAMSKYIPWLRYGYSSRLSSWLRKNANSYDAIILNGLWNYSSYGAWRVLRKLEVPYFVFPHGMLDPWIKSAYPLKAMFKRLYWIFFEHKVLRDAKAVFFTCEEERKLAAQSFSPYSANEVVVGFGARDAPQNSAEQTAAFFEKAGMPEGRKIILFLSRIHPKKGVDLLIAAFARLAPEFPDWDVVIAGPDQVGLKEKLQQRCDELGVSSRVFWTGMLTGDAKWGAFRAAEIFVLPSHQENFGVVVAESLAMSKPVVITTKVNIWREIETDGVGVVVDDNVDGVERGVRQMLNMTPEQRQIMGEKGRETFLHRFDIERNAMELIETINQFASKTSVNVDADSLDSQRSSKSATIAAGI
jgi:glycosyltransferase involved in cell wall biosynthesis